VRTIAERAIGMLGMSQQVVKLGASSWRDQYRAACSPTGGGDEDDEDDGEGPKEPARASIMQYILHIFALPWKLLVACVPPPSIGGGWPCFVAAISVIGGMTALIGDFANLLGCSMGLKGEVVAFTFVALGTSLPDTFASRSAAMGDPTADAAVGNVTGSNAVNVFLGCGVAWIVGAIYWSNAGHTADWQMRYAESVINQPMYGGDHTLVPPGLAVPAGTLGISVITFCVCAIICIATMAARRMAFGYELGTKMRWPTAVFFIGLWLTYVSVSTAIAYST